MATQAELSLNMIRQLRLLDPSVSAEVGTPERKIFDTVAQELANAQIDLQQLNSALDLSSKFGSDLDNFLAIFGFARQTGAQATGYVTFSRTTVSTFAIPIPTGTQVSATSITAVNGSTVSLTFATTAHGELAPGQLEVTIPVRCTASGSIGNVASNAISGFGRSPVLGITTVVNATATTGGADPETDAALKVRFKNTVFRNLAGTEDQFLALAIATAFTSKANAVGPISRYQEYIQVPDVDDATNDPDSGIAGNGAAGEWTSALSSIPYSKHVYNTLPYYLTNGDTTSLNTIFYRQEVDFRINTESLARDKGDTYRGRIFGGGLNVFTDAVTTYQPNLTFFNVYTGTNEEVIAVRAGDILLFEHSYMSDASRNDYERQILNCVDVYINGQNAVQADAITVKPGVTFASVNQFNTNSTNRYYIENYRRVGEPERRPVAGNFFFGLFWTPVLTIPDKIVTPQGIYLEGFHYWAVEDVSELGRSVRARTGIEWNSTIKAFASGDTEGSEQYTGPTITANTADSLEVIGYTYDRNIVDLQTSLESNKQITSDVLAHQSVNRNFKLDITVMYTTGFSIASVNSNIRTAIETYFDGAYFGTTIQLSDILQAIHNVAGVDNVRWSRDVLEQDGKTEDAVGNPRYRIVECDRLGNPLCNFLFDRRTYGNGATQEVQIGYYTGNVTGGSFLVRYKESAASTIAFGKTAAEIKTILTGESSAPLTSVTGNGTPLDPFVFTFSDSSPTSNFRTPLYVSQNHLTGSTAISATTVYNSDFFLKDDELPALPTGELTSDTLPGLIIRQRAQNTWSQV